MHTTNFKILPNGKVRLYDFVDNPTSVAQALARHEILVTQLACAGDDLENYFIGAIGGESHV